MAMTTVSDFVIWTKHVQGDAELVRLLLAMGPGETVRLRIEGVSGTWRRMDNGSDGRPTLGLRPVGQAQRAWRDLYQTRRGAEVVIELVDGMEEAESKPFQHAPLAPGKIVRTELERRAAIEAFLNAPGKGWRSDGTKMSRDEMHER